MCLIVTSKNYSKNIFQKIFGIEPKIKSLIAKKDIICYKAYIETDIFGVVKSPYQKTLNLVGKPLPTVELRIGVHFSNWIDIHQGYHTQINKNDYELHSCDDYVIYECTIPKGSIYYRGDYGGTNNGYVSNNLMINERISEGN